MTRIIAGTLGGRVLTVPRKGTRPTSDRVREAVFSYLDHGDVLRGASVLDLFAGSGGLGFEALSRGADHVTLVDNSAAAIASCQTNAGALGVGERTHIVKARAEKFALSTNFAKRMFDLVFCDPPYEYAASSLANVVSDLAAHGLFSPAALLVIEKATRDGRPLLGDVPFKTVSSKKYGETTVWFAHLA